MRSLVYTGPKSIIVENREQPVPAENQVKLRIRYCGICGSDVHGYLGTTGRRTPPMVMGHEFSAEVVECGAGAGRFRPGDRVTALPIINCGVCPRCLSGNINACDKRRFLGVMDVDGAFSEYLCCDEKMLFLLPDGIDDITGAMIEPFAVAYHAVQKAMPIAGKNVFITGAGTIGLLVLVIAKHFGAASAVVADLSDQRLSTAKQFGADLTVNTGSEDVGQVLSAAGLRDAIEVSFEAVGVTPTAQLSLQVVCNTGTVVWVGNNAQMISINMQQIVTRELRVLGTYIYNAPDYRDSIDLLASGVIDVRRFISKTVGAAEAPRMFEKLASGDTSLLKVLVDMRLP